MAGTYLDNDRVNRSIEKWENSIISSDGKWEGNNLHIDEIDSLSNIHRSEWIRISFLILNTLKSRLKFSNSLILFLHIDLEYSKEKMFSKKLTLNWLEENVSENTPPSLHFTSLEYYNDFYKKELIVFDPDNSILEVIHSSQELTFFCRIYFDEAEEMYSKEVYVFGKA